MSKEEKELQKLDLEITALQKPWYLKPANVFSFVGLVLAIAGVLIQGSISKIEKLQAEEARDIAKKQEEETKKEIILLEKELAMLSEKASRIRAEEKKLQATYKSLEKPTTTTKSTPATRPKPRPTSTTATASARTHAPAPEPVLEPTATEPMYITDVWAFGVKENVVNLVKEYLTEKGYEVGYGGLLGSRPSWLALNPTVFYYHSDSENIAIHMADELMKKTGIKFEARRGAGLGVAKGEKNITFFVHIVQ